VRIRAITPIRVGATELARRQRRYRRLSPAAIEVTLVDLEDGPDVPRALETEDDVRRSERLVVAEARRTNAEEFDVVLPDCVLDPGVGVGADTPVPLVGILSLTAHLLAGTGARFAALTRNEAIAAELAAKVRDYGLADRLTEVRVLGLDVATIPDDSAWADAIGRAVGDLPVATVVNGCSAVELQPHRSGPVIVDPTATALRVLGLVAESGLAPRAPAAAR